MKKKRISDIISNLDENIIEEATTYQKSKVSKKTIMMRWTAACAACLIVIVGVAIAIPQFFNNNDADKPEANGKIVSIGGITREYKKDINISENNATIVWPWKYLEIQNQYPYFDFNGKKYELHASSIDQSYIGENLGEVTAYGYDETEDDKKYQKTFKIYSVKSVRTDFFVALYMDNKYVMFMDSNYISPPSTLGNLINNFNLTENIELKRFENYTNYKGDKGTAYYNTKNGDKIWEELLKVADTPCLIEDVDLWLRGEREFTSFTMTSEALGIYKKVMYITNDGYLSTNIFGPGYVYVIGEGVANKIINCAMENAVKTESEPYNYNYSLAGTITEIGKDYFLIDDSILCENQDDGMAFRVDAKDMKIWKYIDGGYIEVGDIVSVDFYDEIDVKNGNLIKDAYRIATSVYITDDGNYEILE